jgi:hypothetical protein
VAVGDDADIPMMTMLADIGGGRFYAADRRESAADFHTGGVAGVAFDDHRRALFAAIGAAGPGNKWH